MQVRSLKNCNEGAESFEIALDEFDKYKEKVNSKCSGIFFEVLEEQESSYVVIDPADI